MRVVEGGRGGVAVCIPVGVPVGVSIAPAPVLSVVVVAIPVLVPISVLVLVPVRIIGGAEANELTHVGLLDDGLATVLHCQFGDGCSTGPKSPWSGRAAILDDSDHLIRAIRCSLLVEFDTIDHSEGAAVSSLDPCAGGMKKGRGGAGAEEKRNDGDQEAMEEFHGDALESPVT